MMKSAWTLRAIAAVAIASAPSVLVGGCGEAEPSHVVQDESERGSLLLVVTVDWEGRDLTEQNLAAMEGLRVRFPELRLSHFLNAAYFTKSGAKQDEVGKQIARAVLPEDERGLHIHGWKQLFEAAGVEFRDRPTFWDADGIVTGCASSDCGHEVPISAYEVSELRQVIRFSVDTLDERGFGRATSFRAGGWMANDNVTEALVLEGFTTENSAVPAKMLASEIGHLPLHAWVEELWAGTESTSQPFWLATESGELVEVPDNGALADYMRAEEMFEVYQACAEVWRDDPRRDVVVSIGFHQETAAKFLPRVEDALEMILTDAKKASVPVRIVTTEEAALGDL